MLVIYLFSADGHGWSGHTHTHIYIFKWWGVTMVCPGSVEGMIFLSNFSANKKLQKWWHIINYCIHFLVHLGCKEQEDISEINHLLEEGCGVDQTKIFEMCIWDVCIFILLGYDVLRICYLISKPFGYLGLCMVCWVNKSCYFADKKKKKT